MKRYIVFDVIYGNLPQIFGYPYRYQVLVGVDKINANILSFWEVVLKFSSAN